MKLLISILFFALIQQSLFAEERKEDHDALRKIKALYEEAVAKDQLETMKPYLSENTTGVMMTGDVIKGYAGLTAYWTKMKDLMGKNSTYRFEILPDDLSQFYGDIAVSTGTTKEYLKTEVGEYQFKSFWTVVCQKINGEWKIVRFQVGLEDPINNVFVQALHKKNKLTYGGGGLFLGLLLGILGIKIFRKKGNSST